MDFTTNEYGELLKRCEYFAASSRFYSGNDDLKGQNVVHNDLKGQNIVHIKLPGELHVPTDTCFGILKLLAVPVIDVNALIVFSTQTLVCVADFFQIQEIFRILNEWYFTTCPAKSPTYLAALKGVYPITNVLIRNAISKIYNNFQEISKDFITKSNCKQLKKKVRDVLRARKYASEISVNKCVVCSKDCIFRPEERHRSRRGLITSCCGTFIHNMCVYAFVKNSVSYCPRCSTGLDGGSPYMEGETLHTTLLRMRIRDSNGICRKSKLQNVINKYCHYKTPSHNWVCEKSLCQNPMLPKFMEPSQTKFQKTC
jgi:hypothetical protein